MQIVFSCHIDLNVNVWHSTYDFWLMIVYRFEPSLAADSLLKLSCVSSNFDNNNKIGTILYHSYQQQQKKQNLIRLGQQQKTKMWVL